MFSIRLDKNIERSLNELAALTQETKSAMIREAILQYIDYKSITVVFPNFAERSSM
ncbi:MAG: ribbon-helix-helix protein, CopG family [Alphaproteobacteria bacterium]|nr:ribbon-helix-helix protein, CopG family [Alphaproteobacteria bacterium]